MKFFKAVLSIMLLVALLGIMSGVAVAGTPPLPPTKPGPTSAPASGGGSSGGNNGPTFTPFVAPLLSSDGSTIGSLTGKTAYVVDLLASKNSSIGAKNFTLTMEAEMAQRPPDDAKLDILIEAPDGSGLPKGMDDVTLLGMVNISKHVTSGWVLKTETLKLTFNVPGTPSTDAGAVYYLVRYDGSGYYVQNATLKSSAAGTMTFEVKPGADSGLFTLVTAGSALVTPTPTPTVIAMSENMTKTTNAATTSPGTLSILGVDIYVILAIIGGTLVTIGAIASLLYMLYFKK